MVVSSSVLLVAASLIVKGWRSCDVTSGPFRAVGDGLTKDTVAIRTALLQCDEVRDLVTLASPPPRARAAARDPDGDPAARLLHLH